MSKFFFTAKTKEIEIRGTKPKEIKRLEKPTIRENVRVDDRMAVKRPTLPSDSKMPYEQQEKLVDRSENVANKLEGAFKFLEKVMEKANTTIESMVKISEINLETERIKLRRLEVEGHAEKKLENLEGSRAQVYGGSEPEPKRKRTEEIIEVASANRKENLLRNKDVEVLKRTIEKELSDHKLNIKREYKLTQKSKFDLWLDYLKSELRTNNLIDVIDSNITGPENLSDANY